MVVKKKVKPIADQVTPAIPKEKTPVENPINLTEKEKETVKKKLEEANKGNFPNGDTEHVYEKVKTSFKDKEGNEIPGNPSELVGKEYDAYDINLKDANNGETQPRGEVTVTIKVKLKVEKLYHIDGGLKEIPFTYENGKITFKTNHFSVYAVVYGNNLF